MGATALGQTLTTSMIESMGNNTLFTRWRPQNHFIAPAGWMNDPCGLMYDPTEDLYHAFYQWHPEHINWGNISWGHATSRDMISWTDVGGWEGRDALALSPAGNGSYDGLGIFSGTAQPVNLTGGVDGTLLVFYTSVSKLPTSWSIPYQNGTESQSLAMSTDGGKTWQQYENNPVIEGPVSKARVQIAQIKSHQMALRLLSVLLPSFVEKNADFILAFSLVTGTLLVSVILSSSLCLLLTPFLVVSLLTTPSSEVASRALVLACPSGLHLHQT